MPRNCFVIMPFRPELSFLYRFIKEHVEHAFDVECQRGDDEVLTIPLLDKIKDMIVRADFVIADVSGRNPNVFYELGMAHARDKDVILITHDDIADAPTDIKAYEFVKYTHDQEAFVNRLDKAIRGIVGGDYEALFQAARAQFTQFQADTGLQLPERTQEEFISAVTAAVPAARLPDPEDSKLVARKLITFMLPALDADVAGPYAQWVEEKYP